jgi:Sulfotransferase family
MIEMSNFRLLMLSAMYENGGNTTHRFLDGHPQMFVYPFESQLGTQLVIDRLSSMFPAKYRWPVFALDATPEQDYKAIIDEECKIRSRTPQVSKFRHMPFEFSDEERGTLYALYIKESGRSRAKNVTAFFRATFDAWKDYKRTSEQAIYVGYSPIVVVDAEKILTDFPLAHVLHVIRNPWSAYADTKKRPVPLSLQDYMLGWSISQSYAMRCQRKFPNRVHIVRAEDLMKDPFESLGAVCERMGLEAADSLKVPSWNGTRLEEIYPWGTIRYPTPQANQATAEELSLEEREEIRLGAREYLESFDYKNFLKS